MSRWSISILVCFTLALTAGPAEAAGQPRGAPANDDCSAATPIAGGTLSGDTSSATQDGSATCGFSALAPDVWFRYSSPTGGRVFAHTAGSDFDAVLSLHSGCPGTVDNELICGQTEIGQPAAVDLFVEAGTEVLLRLSGYAGDSGPWNLAVGPAGAISGRVTDAATGEPLASVDVSVVRERDLVSVGFATTDPEGGYTAGGLAAGGYYVIAGSNSNYLAELFADIPCCEFASGTTVAVSLGEITAGIDFQLDLGATLTGRVTDASTAGPVPDARVEVFDTFGNPVASDVADAAGTWAVAGLPGGSYYLQATSAEHQDEVYDDLPCPRFSFCDPTLGAQVAVETSATAGGLDFVLDRLGSISGVVRDSVTGDPIPHPDVTVFDEVGFSAGFAVGDESGAYVVGGLPAGSYLVSAEARRSYRGENWDGVPCPARGCEGAGGARVAVALNAETPGIDFALERLGSISGVVRDSATGDPIPFVDVDARFADEPIPDAGATTDAFGRFRLDGLAAGDWYVRTSAPSFQDEVYDDIPCPGGDCSFFGADRVPVTLATDTPGIDFALERLGAISGRVTDAATGAPLAFYGVRAFDDDVLDAYVETGAEGRYVLENLPSGDYFVRTDGPSPRYQDELYDDVPCFGSCPLDAGTPVSVALATTTPGIDFALEPRGSLAGTVTDAGSGGPLGAVSVNVFDGTGSYLDTVWTDATGSYVFESLTTGDYFLTATVDSHSAELYDGFSCQLDCDPTTGTRVAVVNGQPTVGVDFALTRLGSISGTVTDAATGAALAFREVRARRTDGLVARSAVTDDAGRYVITGLSAGSYRATAVSEDGLYVDERYDGRFCVRDLCDPLSGTSIAVSLDATVSGIDFSLEPAATILGTVTSAATGEPVPSTDLRLWGTDGRFLGLTFPDFDGRYLFRGLPGATYFVSATHAGDFADEVWDGALCPPVGCDPVGAGTPIVLPARGVVTDIDFDLEPAVVPDCTPSETALCLSHGRFRVEAAWRDFSGGTGSGQAFELTRDTGYFWFFNPENVELVVKVLDACTLDGFENFWVFAAGLTDVEVELTVTDTVSDEVQTYSNALGSSFQPILDTAAFETCPGGARGLSAGAEPERVRRELEALLDEASAGGAAAGGAAAGGPAPPDKGGCVPDIFTLCLNDGRFEVRAFWETPLPQTGQGQAFRLTRDTGYFWFFDRANVELVVKVIDACEFDPFHNFWIFAAGLTNVRVQLVVTDTVSGETREWVNPQGTAYQPITETGDFRTCDQQ